MEGGRTGREKARKEERKGKQEKLTNNLTNIVQPQASETRPDFQIRLKFFSLSL